MQMVADICERAGRAAVNQFGRALGLSADGTHTATQQSSENIDAIMQSSAIIIEVTQSISREWMDFARERIEQNLNRFDSLLHCRTPQDFAALQSELLRDNLESFLQCARRVAEKSVHVADESARKVAENVERIRAAA